MDYGTGHPGQQTWLIIWYQRTINKKTQDDTVNEYNTSLRWIGPRQHSTHKKLSNETKKSAIDRKRLRRANRALIVDKRQEMKTLKLLIKIKLYNL